MPQITINKGGPSTDIDNGVYPVTLAAVTGPKTIYPANAPEGTDIYEWTFSLDDGRDIQGVTSTASGPKSKMFGWLTALLGKAPAAGDAVDTDALLGRRALATIDHNDGGWPRLSQLTAMPVGMLQQQFAAATAPAPLNGLPAGRRPAAARPAPMAGPVTAIPSDELPF